VDWLEKALGSKTFLMESSSPSDAYRMSFSAGRHVGIVWVKLARH